MSVFRLLVVLLLLPAVLTAQESGSAAVDHDLDVFVQDAADIFSSPADFDARDWWTAGAILAATAGAYLVDDDVRRVATEYREGGVDEYWRLGDWYGGGAFAAGLGAVTYGGGLAFDDEWTRVTGRMILQSQVYSTAVTHLLKILTGRARPDRGECKSSFTGFVIDEEYWAFPSGHATSAFALSSTLSRRVGSLPLSILLYALATGTVVQRIVADRHWFSDTVLGAAIGTVIALAVVQLEEARERAAGEDANVPLSAGMQPHRPLLQYSISF